MKVITTNLLNRFWKKGIKPIQEELANKINTSKIVKSTTITEEGFLMDGKTTADALAELNGKLSTKIVLNAGYSESANYVVKFGHTESIYAKITGSFAKETEVTVGTLPEGFRPVQRVVFLASSDSTIFYQYLARITIMTTGEVRIRVGGTSITNVQFSTTFLV